jgi:solute:Na+ symporter, SSS family
MPGRLIPALFATIAALRLSAADAARFTWEQLPPLPPSPGQVAQPGFAGPYVGVHHDVLLVAGGANFPEKMPWEGGAKVWWKEIWCLAKTSDGASRWSSNPHVTLPRPMGYGVSVSTPDGIVCAGGSDAARCYAEVFLLSWDEKERTVRTTPLPPMPQPLSMMAGALVGTTVFVAGGQHVMAGAVPTKVFWALDLSRRTRPAEFKWIELPAWPGPTRVLPVAAAQRTPRGEEFFLFSGREPRPGRSTKILTDAFAFNPRDGTWRTLANVGGGAGIGVMGATAAPVGEDEIAVFGGDSGELFLELETHDLAVEQLRKSLGSPGAERKSAIEAQMQNDLDAKKAIYAKHPGFARDIHVFNTRSNTWRLAGRASVPLPVTTTAVAWGKALVVPTGEIQPGIRTPNVLLARPRLE